MFIGGLNWDTTDGILSPCYDAYLYIPLINACYVPPLFRLDSLSPLPASRRFKGLFFTVWKGIAFILYRLSGVALRIHSNTLHVSKVDACTIMRDASGTSRGFAFLTFEDPNAVNLVVGREHFLDGKQVCFVVNIIRGPR